MYRSRRAAIAAGGEGPTAVAEAFTRAFPDESPLPAYLCQLLLTNDPAGAVLFSRWYVATRELLHAMVALGAARPARTAACVQRSCSPITLP